MPRTAALTLSSDVINERSTALNNAYQAVTDAIEVDVDNELVDSAFLHPLTRARDYLGKEAGKMARMKKQLQKEAEANASTPNGTDKTQTGAGAGKGQSA